MSRKRLLITKKRLLDSRERLLVTKKHSCDPKRRLFDPKKAFLGSKSRLFAWWGPFLIVQVSRTCEKGAGLATISSVGARNRPIGVRIRGEGRDGGTTTPRRDALS